MINSNFNELEYVRINYENTEVKINKLLIKLKKCNTFDKFLIVIKEIITIQNHIEQMYDYADIRNMRDSSEEFYNEEIIYWNEYKPKFDLLFVDFNKIILDSKFKDKLVKFLPKNFFNIIEYQLKIKSDKIIELEQKENDLKSRYRSLNKSKILYDEEYKTISSISGLFTNKDRNIRKKAHDAVNDYYYGKQDEYNSVLYELINIRNNIAHKVGFKDYCEMSIYKLKRFGYNYRDINKFRNNILKYFSPIIEKLSDWQKEELSLNKLEYYDTIFFNEMPEYLYQGNELLYKLKDIFHDIDYELGNLYEDMLKYKYIDFLQRENKINFAITNFLVEDSIPVVTANFKNNYLDIKTATHEMGHSFQKYNAGIKDKNYIVSPLLKYPTFEIAEMFSFAMELIVMDKTQILFTKSDYNKFCFMGIYNLVSMLPHLCLVDEFQETIYKKKNLKKEDIRLIWLELEKKYNLKRSNTGHINLETGGYFYRLFHIYLDPFYYIDYALSYFGAICIWDKSKDNLDFFKNIGAVASYYPFNELIDLYDIPNPFDENTVKNISIYLEKELLKRKIRKIIRNY